MSRMFAAAFGGFLTLCAPAPVFAGDTDTDACVEAWKADVQRMVNSRCVTCHQNAAPAGNLSLQRGTAPGSLIDQPSDQSELVYVKPGSLEDSYLFRKLEGTHLEAGGSGQRMPLGGSLSESDLAIIETWITGCAGE